MSAPECKSVYLVDTSTDPVVVRVVGRASFQNSNCVRDFIFEMIGRDRRRFVFDFQQCLSMDSTFLGVLAGIALELRKRPPDGSLVVSRVGPRNFELIRSLGLHRLLTIDCGELPLGSPLADKPLEFKKRSEVESARLVLQAHENLVTADAENQAKFQDVLTFLRNRVAE